MAEENVDRGDDDEIETTIATIFDSICFEYGDHDAIVGPDEFLPICYTELQQSSLALAYQLYHRYRPTYVLLDLRNAVAAEAVAMLACIRIDVPFVPVSVKELHSGDRLDSIVTSLRHSASSLSAASLLREEIKIVAVVRCDDDTDPILVHFAHANVHNVVYVNDNGDLLEPMDVPATFPSASSESSTTSTTTTKTDDLYILFTSGTSGNNPKAVIGSHLSTLHRLNWFAETFPFSLDDDDTIVARRSKLTFVDSITELFSALLYPPGVLYALDPNELAGQGVSVILSTPCTRVTMLPSQLSQLLLLLSTTTTATENSHPLHSALKTIIVSGEPCPGSLLIPFRKHFPNTRLVNLYGQTESTGDVLCAVLTDMEHPMVDNVMAVGFPIPKVSISLSANDELVVTGNLSNGYLHLSPEHRPMTSFSTGDVGFCRDGCWYVKGRLDDLAKINGVLTSPAEVEAVFAKTYTTVSSCAAVLINGAFYILAQVTTDNKGEIPFSRESMKEAGLPWNLIPKSVFFQTSLLPTGTSGAGKVNRIEVTTIIQELLANLNRDNQKITHDNTFIIGIVSNVLGSVVVDEKRSFVELGGDSALAVTLLYQLKSIPARGDSSVTTRDILESDSIEELCKLLKGETVIRRKRSRDQNNEEYNETKMSRMTCNKKVEHVKHGHVTVQFRACVDSSALVAANGTDIYGACQGGVIQKIQNLGTTVDVAAQCTLDGWSIQAGVVLVGDTSLVVSGYSRNEDRGIVVAMSLDLSSVHWTRHVQGKITSTPLKVGGLLYVLAGSVLHVMDVVDGKDDLTIELPSSSESRPVSMVPTRGNRSPLLIYAFSEWDAGLAVLAREGNVATHGATLKVAMISDIACPVYADLLAIGENRVAVCDIAGCMHDVNVETLTVQNSVKVSSQPIFSSPVMVGQDQIVFGCHDGIVRCVKACDFAVTLWCCNAQAVVYCKPLVMPDQKNQSRHEDGSIPKLVVVCTTAGDIVVITADEGVEKQRFSVGGEIWSDPVEVTSALGGEQQQHVAFGARDSKLHFITLAS
jgi:acyl-CoA synthetase (AMP-forming)/AMP-acid ligase II